MKTSKWLLIVIIVTFSIIKIKGQSVVSTAGGSYKDEAISLDFTIGEPLTETYQSGSVILTQGFQQPYNFYLQQIIDIPEGWSGISSYIDPRNKGVEGIFDNFSNNFIILSSMQQFYYPQANVNTIGNWNYKDGYKIKTENGFSVTLTGSKISDRTIEIVPGWNLIPVLSSCQASVEGVFSEIEPVKIVKQIAGTGVYWPAYNINTLQNLLPGMAYFVASNEAATVSFPSCSKSSNIKKEENSAIISTPWNELHYTASSHAIAFPADVLANSALKPGDVLGAFSSGGLCTGQIEITNLTSGFAMIAFGNDETTPDIDGFEDGEMLQFKVYRPAENLEINLNVEFEPALPQQGIFTSQGMSAAKSLILDKVGLEEVGNIKTNIFPNPSGGVFTLTMSSWPSNLQIQLMDASGQRIKTFKPGTNINGSAYAFDMSDLPKGIYFLKLVDVGYLEVKKLVIN